MGDIEHVREPARDGWSPEREADLDRREAALERRIEVARDVLVAAAARDAVADDRDGRATRRDHDDDLAAFVDPLRSEGYGWDTPGRRHAALDRGHAKDDRSSAAVDRTILTADLDAGPVAPDPHEDDPGHHR